MEIRIAKDERDARSISYVYAMSWKAGYAGIIAQEYLDSIPLDFGVKSFAGNYATRRFESAILSAAGQDIGACAYGCSRDYAGDGIGEIPSFYFLEGAWGKGYAKELMRFALDRLAEQDFAKVHLWALRENIRARRFYEKCGFALSENARVIEIAGQELAEVEYVISQ